MNIETIGQAAHSLAAIAFAFLALWAAPRWRVATHLIPLSVAAALTALWALLTAMHGTQSVTATVAEGVRNAGWLGFLYAIWREGDGARRTGGMVALYLVIFAVTGGTIGTALLLPWVAKIPAISDAIALALNTLRMVMAIGGLVLVHNLYIAARTESRGMIRFPMAALAALWLYDLNLYTMAYLDRSWTDELAQLRGMIVLAAAPALALAGRRGQGARVVLSRTMTFQSVGLVACCLYLVTILGVTSLLDMIGGEEARMAQILFIFAMSLAALVVLPSQRFRAWTRVKLAKHLFRHRYDYRAEWLRFTETLGQPGNDGASLGFRIVKAVGDIVESPGGLLLVPEAGGTLAVHGEWNWPQGAMPTTLLLSEEPRRWFADTGRVIEIDRLRAEASTASDDEARHVPQWMIADPRAWVLVPLIHFGQLAGLVLLERPLISRNLDWEDFDLLKVVGRQVASYLAEARGQEALSDVQRFDEFNRRFAFIMHDIKNLVSQLSLLTRNAERHADNPEFRADMIATLKNSTGRMNDLLARLSQHNKGKGEAPRPVAAGRVCEAVAAQRKGQHPVVIGGDMALMARADPQRLEQALSHLLHNAIDASPVAEPVSLLVSGDAGEVRITVADRGTGMSAAFIREQLFKPFVSTKDGGFGIGAFEAQALIAGMGGRLEVTSAPGKGTDMTIVLPLARGSDGLDLEPEALAA
jgi:putative PEP-CTERM system histidine kinase